MHSSGAIAARLHVARHGAGLRGAGRDQVVGAQARRARRASASARCTHAVVDEPQVVRARARPAARRPRRASTWPRKRCEISRSGCQGVVVLEPAGVARRAAAPAPRSRRSGRGSVRSPGSRPSVSHSSLAVDHERRRPPRRCRRCADQAGVLEHLRLAAAGEDARPRPRRARRPRARGRPASVNAPSPSCSSEAPRPSRVPSRST